MEECKTLHFKKYKTSKIGETEQMLKNEHIQCVIRCPNWKYTNIVLIAVQININKGVLISAHKN